MNKAFILPIAVFIIVCMYLTGCYYNSEEKLYPTNSSGCESIDVKYNPTITDILSQNCYSCHAGSVASSFGGGVILDSYEEAKSRINLIYSAVSHQSGYPFMPKDAAMLDSCKIKAIKIWMDAGTPNN